MTLTTYAKTGSKILIDDLEKLDIGISHAEAIFTLDKWAEWLSVQSLRIPSNIKTVITAPQVFYNIGWSNKNRRLEARHTNSNLIQKYNLDNHLANLEAAYDLKRKYYRSFKSSSHQLSSINFKRGTPKLLDYHSDFGN